MTYLVLGSILFYMSIAWLNNKKIIALQRDQVLAHSKRESKFVDVFNNIEVIKSYNVETRYRQELQKQFTDYENKKKALDHHVNKYNTTINLAQLFVLLTSFLYVATGILNGQHSIGILFAVFILISRFNGSMRKIIILNINLQGALIAISRLRDFIQLDVKEDSQLEQAKEEKTTKPNPNALIELQDLTFKYAGYEPIVEQVNLVIPKPGFYCLVGPNGTGKSTFLKVLKNFYPPTSGKIHVQGKEQSDYNTEDWNSTVAYIEQIPKIINESVYENLTLTKGISEQEVTQFLNSHDFDEFINTFPDGLNTRIGLGGLPISGGQKQIISILRGLMINPKILLLDEPTASIDDINKVRLLNVFKHFKKDKVILISSHDTQLIENCDLIYEISNRSVSATQLID